MMASDTQPARLSLAVWDIPPTVVAGERFVVKAGAVSSAGCGLGGRRIEARNAGDEVVAAGALGGSPWPGTRRLLWTELSLPAPATCGMTPFSVRCGGADLDPAHRDGTSRFSVVVTPQPQHVVTIEVVTNGTAAPVPCAQVRLGPYSAETDAAGRAALRVAVGRYELRFWKVGFDAPATTIGIDGDRLLRLEAVIVPEENADRAWRG
jgi:hypothetical protein